MLKQLQHIIYSLTLTTSLPLFADQIDPAQSAYCVKAGGSVVEMTAVFSTARGNVSGYTKPFCLFTPDNGQLAIGLETFASSEPSIAATFIKKLDSISTENKLWQGKYPNPSHNVCKNLGGAGVGFITSGGFSDASGQSDICVFGDGSMVSGWSLIYMANHREGFDEVKDKVKAEPLVISTPK